MAEISNWMHVDTFTVAQAAALWCEIDPSAISEFANSMPSEAAAIHQMLSGAIVAGELAALTDTNAFALIGNHSASLVQRSDLVAYAKFRNLFPAFLFDTIAPLGPQKGLPAPQVSTAQPFQSVTPTAKGGRPPTYDWDAFISEIVRIANTPDGLPDKQADLIKVMQSWFSETYDAEPAESSIKERISKIYGHLRAHSAKSQ